MDKPTLLIFAAKQDVTLANGLHLHAGQGIALPIPSISVYNMGLLPNDEVKLRTTDAELPEQFRGKTGKVLSTMTLVTVELEDGSVETFNREQMKLRMRDGLETHQQYGGKLVVDGDEKEPWQG